MTTTKPALPEPDTARLLREAVDGVMAHQWSNTRPAMHALQVLIDTAADTATELDAAVAEARAVPDTLCQQLQQQCSDWGVYWRAPDAHGVNLSLEQAHELLRTALGVEVEIAATPSPAEQLDTVPWPEVTRYSGGASHEGIGGRVWIRLSDEGPDVEYVPAEQPEPAVLSKVAAIAHAGGLVGLSGHEALVAIRRLTLGHYDRTETMEQATASVRAALSGEQP